VLYTSSKKLFGIKIEMSISVNKTFLLWNKFMSLKKLINYDIISDLISLQVYNKDYFKPFDPNKEFIKYAPKEVHNFSNLLNDFLCFELEVGLYLIFEHKGNNNGHETLNYIINVWFPNSAYDFDNRTHFEVLSEKYDKDSDNSEEEIWIPFKPRLRIRNSIK